MKNGYTENRQTFAAYLAKQYIAKKEYVTGSVPEANALVASSDIVLTRSDGMTLQIICLIDREANPGKLFSLPPEKVHEIGEQCLKYTGTVNRAKMPVVIQIFEIGGTPINDADRERLKGYKRKSIGSKVVISAWGLDTTSGSIWSNSVFGGFLAKHSFIGKLMREPRASDAELLSDNAVVIAQQRFPVLACALVATLIGVFVGELIYGVEPFGDLLTPGLKTTLALGGLNSNLILESGEWHRLFTAIFLHGNIVHLVSNGIALLMVGFVLESLVGRLWFAGLFLIGGLSGSLFSLAINPANVVSVGASGAIMGLFAAAYICSFRLPLAAGRTPIQMQLMRVLIPSLIPLATSRLGAHIDFGAHLGGAIGGAIAGFVLLKSWAPESVAPKFRKVAAVLTIAGLTLFATSAIAVKNNYPRYALSTKLIPDDQLPKTDADAKIHSSDLLAQYPDDPRSHFYRAAALFDAPDAVGAEKELRAALANSEVLKTQFKPELELRLRAMLAIVLGNEGKTTEAKLTAAPACAALSTGDLRDSLANKGFCQ